MAAGRRPCGRCRAPKAILVITGPRSSAFWVVLAMIVLLLGALIADLRHRRLQGRPQRLVSYWPIGVFLLVITSHSIFVRQALNPLYTHQSDLTHHNFWNLILDWMEVHPDLEKKGRKRTTDPGSALVFTLNGLLPRQHRRTMSTGT